jgi:hypothetical protein
MRWKMHWRVAAALMCGAAGLVGAGFALGVPSELSATTSAPNCGAYEVLLAHSDGAVSVDAPSACADPTFYGSMAGKALNSPIVGLASTPDGGGYWLVAADGGVFSFGNAQFYGSEGSVKLNAPIVGIASSPDGLGYWLVASDGGIFAFGDAGYHGSMGGTRLNQPVVGMAADAQTGGYWLTAADGGVFNFDAPYFGSLGNLHLNAPIRFVTGTPDDGGYRMVGSDGGVFNFGDAIYYGSAATAGSRGWGALATTPDGDGYWLFAGTSSGNGATVDPFGDASPTLSGVGGNSSGAPIIGAATLFAATVPVVTTEPVSQRVDAGTVATFSAAASGLPMPSVQWQASVDNGKTFVDIANATSTTLSFTTVSSESGGQYRAVFTNAAGRAVTAVATLTIGDEPQVTTQPASQKVDAGAVVTFTAAAAGTPAPSIQWQVSSDEGSTFSPVASDTTDTLSFTTTAADDGNQYRAIFTSSSGSATTDTATLVVIPAGDVIPSSAGGYFADASCGTSTMCVAVGGTATSGALIELSDNGGSSFFTAAVPSTTSALRSVSCNDASHCVAIGLGSVLESIDGGVTWSTEALPTVTLPAPPAGETSSYAYHLLGVACSSDADCMAVGSFLVSVNGSGIQSPEYIYSTDGGQTWANSTAPTEQVEMGAVMCYPGFCIAAGEALARSTDGGATWQAVPFGNEGLFDVACTVDASACLTIGTDSATVTGQLGVSTDQGQTWTDQAADLPSGTGTIQTISCGSTTACMVVGPEPSNTGPLVVAVTGNSGTNWVAETGPSGFTNPPTASGNAPYPDVTCTSVSACFVVGTGSAGPVVSVTSDFGQTWTPGAAE